MSWKPSLTCEYDNFALWKRDHCSWQFFEHCLCLLFQSLYSLCDDEVTFQMCWVYSSRSLCVSVMWESLNCVHTSWSQILQTEEEQALFAKLSWLHKMLCQTQDCAKQKTLCLLKKMNNDNNGDENSSAWDLVQLFDNMSNDFWQFNLVTSPSQSAEVFFTTVEVFYEFSCVFRGVVFFSFDEIVGFSANHPFSRMFSTWYFFVRFNRCFMVWSGMNWLQHWSMNAWNTECIRIFLSKSSS
jgi:hypothetical protein